MIRPPSLLTQKCMRKNDEEKQSSEKNKEDNAFCGTTPYFHINHPKQVIATLS